MNTRAPIHPPLNSTFDSNALGLLPESPIKTDSAPALSTSAPDPVPEIGGRSGHDPTRYGDWEKKGRCVDF